MYLFGGSRTPWFVFPWLLAFVWVLIGCTSPSTTEPTQPPVAQQIVIGSPQPGAIVSSPILLSGSTALPPQGGVLVYRLFDPANNQIASSPFPVTTAAQPSPFSVQIQYTVPADGMGRIELVELDTATGQIRAIASMSVMLTANTTPVPTLAPPTITTPLPVQPSPTTTAPTTTPTQAIVIDTPPPGTQIGSPVVLTGRTALFPTQGTLNYRVSDAAGTQLGQGSFQMNGSPGQPGTFTASLNFTLPPNGGPVRVELFEQNTATGAVTARAVIDLAVAPPQAIAIDTPAPGTQVGSPVVLTGRAARYPFQGNLAYKVFDSTGRQIGDGYFPVSGGPGQPSSYNASLVFTPPPDGGQIRVDILDQDAVTNTIAASSSINLQVAPQPQAILIDSPPPGTAVGSPVVLTGRTVRYPYQGSLFYRIVDVNGNQLGAGSFAVPGAPGQGTTFTVSLTFTATNVVGPIRAELIDRNPATGAVFATASLDMVVLPPRPQPPTQTPTSGQVIRIDTPAPGTQVGSPLVVTGSTLLFPPEGRLNYRVRDTSGRELGAGVIQVATASGGGSTFVASLTFTVQAGGGTIIVDITQPGSTTTASIELYVAPR